MTPLDIILAAPDPAAALAIYVAQEIEAAREYRVVGPGHRALLRDCRDAISLALRAVQCEAFPGPAWRKNAANLVKTLDAVTKP